MKRLKLGMKNRRLTLSQKVCGTLLILLLYRILSHVPLPFVNNEYISKVIDTNGTMGMFNALTGGNLENMSLMALGITPYITASIVLQLMGVVIPRLSEIQKEGSVGQRRMKHITIVLATALSLLQSVGMLISYGHWGMITPYRWYAIAIPAVLMTLGVTALSFAGQYISDHLFGNGISLILVTGILCSFVSDGQTLFYALTDGRELWLQIVLVVVTLIVVVLLFAFATYLMDCEKRIHVTYSVKMAANSDAAYKNEGVIPLKLMAGSVVPIIFASTLFSIPSMIQLFGSFDVKFFDVFDTTRWLKPEQWWASLGMIVYFVLIIWFTYYYQMLNLNEKELANNLKKQGGVITGIRPGKPTADYLHRQMRYLTLLGGLALCVIALVPIVATSLLGVSHVSFLGTSILIIVSVLLETGKKYQADRKGKFYSVSDNFMGVEKPDMSILEPKAKAKGRK